MFKSFFLDTIFILFFYMKDSVCSWNDTGMHLLGSLRTPLRDSLCEKGRP